LSRSVQILVFAAVASVALVAGYLSGVVYRQPAVVAGPPMVSAPHFSDLDGGIRRFEEWRGRVVVVNFWASWCTPCREEMPVFIRLQARLGQGGLQFVGVAIDEPVKAGAFARELGVNYPTLLGAGEGLSWSRALGNQAGVLPYTVIFDRQGTLVARHAGALKESEIEALFRPFL